MIVLELGQIVDILVHDDPKVVRLAVRRDVVLAESLGHVEHRFSGFAPKVYEVVRWEGIRLSRRD